MHHQGHGEQTERGFRSERDTAALSTRCSDAAKPSQHREHIHTKPSANTRWADLLTLIREG